jgi:uncharacterized membrane protein
MPTGQHHASHPAARHPLKYALWGVMGAMTISVIVHSEIPLIHHAQQMIPSLLNIPWILGIHIVAGTVALLSGPLQFSSRLRRQNIRLHRILGRTYVTSVCVAAPLAFVLALNQREPGSHFFIFASIVQGGIWLLITLIAFLTARNRHIQQHREWFVRSYAITFTFVVFRVFRPLMLWKHLGRNGLPMAMLTLMLLSLLISDIALHWHEITTRRA